MTGDIDLKKSLQAIARATIIITTVHIENITWRNDFITSIYENFVFYYPHILLLYFQPEKWDSLTRSWKEHLYLLGSVDLLLLDEVHHLGDERGSTLETVVVRMRLLSQAYHMKKLSAATTAGQFLQERYYL